MKLFCLFFAVICAAAPSVVAAERADEPTSPNVHLRGSLSNSQIALERDGKALVAFIGGSITEMDGYRPMVTTYLKQRFPNATLDVTAAGISSTCSTTGAFRIGTDVLAHGPLDLLLLEFAVNDDQDAMHSRRDCIRGIEGIIRQVRRHNPNADVVITYFVNPEMLATIHEGKMPLSIEAHEAVAKHYSIPTVYLAKEVADRISAGTLTWEQYGGVHPAKYGNAIAAELVKQCCEASWSGELASDAAKVPHELPAPLDPNSYERGRFVSPESASYGDGWTLGTPNWKELRGQSRARFAELPMLVCTEPGKTLELEFEGRTIGAFVVAGPDAGIAEVSVDGGPFTQVDLYHRFSEGLHYPRTVIFATDLDDARHTLRLKMSADKHPKSHGHSIRIMQFTAN